MASPKTIQRRIETLEGRMGELGALLAEMADALVHYPGEIAVVHAGEVVDERAAHAAIRVQASEWPAIQEIELMLSNWRTLTAELRVARKGGEAA